MEELVVLDQKQTILIRKMELKEAINVAPIVIDGYEKEYKMRFDVAKTLNTWGKWLCNSNYIALGAFLESKWIGSIVGCLYVNPYNADIEAREVLWYVLPEFRSTKAGSNLLGYFENWAKISGAKRIYMFYFSGIDPDCRMEKMYKRKGFVPFQTEVVKEV